MPIANKESPSVNIINQYLRLFYGINEHNILKILLKNIFENYSNYPNIFRYKLKFFLFGKRDLIASLIVSMHALALFTLVCYNYSHFCIKMIFDYFMAENNLYSTFRFIKFFVPTNMWVYFWSYCMLLYARCFIAQRIQHPEYLF